MHDGLFPTLLYDRFSRVIRTGVGFDEFVWLEPPEGMAGAGPRHVMAESLDIGCDAEPGWPESTAQQCAANW